MWFSHYLFSTKQLGDFIGIYIFYGAFPWVLYSMLYFLWSLFSGAYFRKIYVTLGDMNKCFPWFRRLPLYWQLVEWNMINANKKNSESHRNGLRKKKGAEESSFAIRCILTLHFYSGAQGSDSVVAIVWAFLTSWFHLEPFSKRLQQDTEKHNMISAYTPLPEQGELFLLLF